MAEAAATPKKKKMWKIIGIIFLVLVLIGLVWYFFGGKSVQWKEYAQKDIPGADISNQTGLTLDQAKAKAITLKAAAFVYYPDTKTAWFKSSASNIVDGWNSGSYTVYVPQA